MSNPTEPNSVLLTRIPHSGTSACGQLARGHIDIVNGGSKSWRQSFMIIASVTGVTTISSLLNGVVAVTLPTLAEDLHLDSGLLLWPASVFALTCGCTLLICGAMADVFGARLLYLVGCISQSLFTMACGLSNTGPQLIIFRAFAGIAASMCLPSSVSLFTCSFPEGKRRNSAFASMGGGQPVGFSIGLSLGGVFAETIGWRWSFYLGAILNTAVFILAFFSLPVINLEPVTWHQIISNVDWLGALLASAALSMASYVLAVIADNSKEISRPANIALLATAVATACAFVAWVGHQERKGRPAIIPNTLWKNRIFTSVCLNVFLVWGAFNATETMASFFFQNIQRLSAMETSVRLLPAPVGGILASILMGLLVHRMQANVTSFVAVVVASIAPVLMAIVQPNWSYWACIFPAMLTNSIGGDTLYSISNLIITSLFPSRTQGVAGGVYNTIAQIGKSFGLTITAVITNAVTARSDTAGMKNPAASLEGYRAGFWYCFSLNAAAMLSILWGLRKVGKVGAKGD